jgi:hypothetical protein
MTEPMYVLAVDPGKTSGVALLSWTADLADTPLLEWSSEVNEEDYADEIMRGLHAARDGRFYVACESFTINMQTAKNSQAPWSLEHIGVLKYLCRKNNYPVSAIAFQAPGDAKSMFPNPTLQRLGTWHRGGAGHANDAIRHGLLRMVKASWLPRQILT